MARKILANESGPMPTPVERHSSPNQVDRAVLDSVSKVMLGLTPDDRAEVPRSDPRAVRLEVVRSYLAEQPELRATFEREIEEAWRHATGRSRELFTSLAERRAEILSRAELRHLQQQAPAAVDGFLDDLSRYLVETAGHPNSARR